MIYWQKPDDKNTPLLYMSGFFNSTRRYVEAFERAGCKYRCVSYNDVSQSARVAFNATIPEFHKKGYRMFLDSGAFTLQKDPACTFEKVKAFIDGYKRYIREHEGMYDWYAVVDWRKDSEITAKAQAYMRRIGLKPVPVYHGLDGVAAFEKLIDQGYPLIGISLPRLPGQALDRNRARRLYDIVFDKAERANVALHGLSQTGVLLLKYPWYSADSSTWVKVGGLGRITVIDEQRLKFHTIAMSKQLVDFEHTEGYELARDRMKEWGFTRRELVDDYVARAAFNAKSIMRAVRFKKSNQKWAMSI